MNLEKNKQEEYHMKKEKNKKTTNKPELKEIPDLPQELLKEIVDGNVIIFIGNGVSRVGNIPSWKELALKYLNDWYNSSDGSLSFDMYEQIKNKQPLEILTMCSCHNSFNKNNLDKKLTGHLSQKEKDLLEEIYGYLQEFQAGYITTNYDNYLLQPYKRNQDEEKLCIKLNKKLEQIQEVSFEDFIREQKNGVVYLHGRLSSKFQKPILTLKDYLEHYREYGTGRNFLKNSFNKPILFIGFGLMEFEIIQHIQPPPEATFKNYLLLGISEYEKGTMEQYIKYYEILNIIPIFYNKTRKGYKQLLYVLEEWSKQIIQKRIENYKDMIGKQEDEQNLLKLKGLKNEGFK